MKNKITYTFLFIFAILFIAKTYSSSFHLMNISKGKNIRYKIISESPNITSNSDRLKIELYKRVDKQILKKIAMKLRSSRKQYDRLWIWYFIKGIDPNKGAWAVSHFKPEGLVLKIRGVPLSKIDELKKTTVKQNYDQILGRWLDDSPSLESLTIIYVDKGNIYVQKNYIDGSSNVDKLIKTQQNGKKRYDKVGNAYGEYFIIEKNGNLELYDKDGKFGEDKSLLNYDYGSTKAYEMRAPSTTSPGPRKRE